MPEPFIVGSFKKYPSIWSKSTHWVYFNLIKENSQFGSIFPQTLKEPIGYMVGYIVVKLIGTFWMKFSKSPLGSFKELPCGYFGGYFKKIPTPYPVGKSWVNCFRTLHVLSMDPLGNWALAPSVRTGSLTFNWSTHWSHSAPQIILAQSQLSKKRFRNMSLCHWFSSIIWSPAWITLKKLSWVIYHCPLLVVNQWTTRIENKPHKWKGSDQTLKLGYALCFPNRWWYPRATQ